MISGQYRLIAIPPENPTDVQPVTETDKLIGSLTLKPGKSRVLSCRYSVKYPKDPPLTNAE